MGRAEGQRLKLLYLMNYLLENTDEEHTVKSSEIIDYLKTAYNIPVERKTVYTDISILQEYGLEIEYDTITQGYKIICREFELYELQLLIDSVQSSKFITQKIAKELTDKLKKLTSHHNRKTLDRRNYVANRIRSMNDSVFRYVDDIHSCISDNLKMSFRYFSYTIKKEKKYHKGGEKYIVSPFALLWNDNNYYLLAFDGKSMKHFRVDKMDSISILQEKRQGKEEFKNLNLSERSTKVFSMFGGQEERVTLRFSNHLVGVVIDRFGKDIMIMSVDERHFKINVNVEISPQFFSWLCGFGKAAKVVSPDSVVEKMKKHVSSITEMYQTDEKM